MDVDTPTPDVYAPFLNFCRAAAITVSDSVTLAPVPGMGTGLLALVDLPAHTELFSIPKPAVLSTQTSALKEGLSEAEWEALKGGWGRLILCLMFEDGRGAASPWQGYLDIMPTEFETPMFWSAEQVQELKGTSIFDKIGVTDAEKEYNERLLPVIQAHPELFPADRFEQCFSLSRFHIQGSRILSRSFHVESGEGDGEGGEDSDDELEEDLEGQEGMDVDTVGMVPMADMLNAQWGSENSKLFFTETHLTMITTEPIGAGEQIFNTYARPPNADLLRRYGHVDVIPPSLVGNEEDEVEIRCDVAVECAMAHLRETKVVTASKVKDWAMDDRVEFWLQEGGDDIIPIQIVDPVPPPFSAFLTLLCLPKAGFEKAQKAGKLPRPKLTMQTVEVGKKLIERRLNDYPTALEDDIALIKELQANTSDRRYLAAVVRAGEKNVLTETLKALTAEGEKVQASEGEGGKAEKAGKRKGTDSAAGAKRGKSRIK